MPSPIVDALMQLVAALIIATIPSIVATIQARRNRKLIRRLHECVDDNQQKLNSIQHTVSRVETQVQKCGTNGGSP